jgi:hypothetical protein
VRYRHHRGNLVESLTTAVDMQPTKAALAAHLKVDPSRVLVAKYGEGKDDRCGWDAHVVTVDGNTVGFTDGPLETES